MGYRSISEVVVTVASLFITAALYDQSLKIWRTKSVKDFTTTIVLAILCNEAAWLNYGLSIGEWPVILISTLNMPAALLATAGFFKFREKVAR